MDDTSNSKLFPITLLPDAVFEKAGMTIQWAGINKLGAHTFKRATQNEDKESQYAPCDSKVFQLRTDSILFDPIVRKLVSGSNATFISGQNITSNTSARPETLRLSKQYRSIIRACIEDLQAESKKPKQEFYEQYVAIFYNIEFIWHLTEILVVNTLPGDIVLPHLLEWIQFHFPSGQMGAAKILGGIVEPAGEARYSEYWPTVITVILQGSIEDARALLRLHSQADTKAFLEAELVLDTMPVYNVFGGLSVSEFTTRFNSWQTTLVTKLQENKFASCKNLQLIMKMVSGQGVAEMKQYCSTWCELMVATLLYTEPTVKWFDLIFHANMCINQFGGPSRLKLLDEIILSLLESNLHDVIKKLQLTCDSGWAATHLTNLLFHCVRLNVIDNSIMSGMPHRLDEELVLEYGSLLMGHKSLWQAGVTYLDHCPTLGLARLYLLLPRVPLTSDSRVFNVIRIARQRNMSDVVASVCKVEGMKSIRRKRLGQALNWALQSQDPGFATFLANKILELYASEGVFNSLDLLDNLNSCMLVCDRLTFLGKYCEFHRLYRDRHLKKAVELLISLIASKMAPKYFWLTLLTDTLTLLVDVQDVLVFSSRDTHVLINCLQEFATEACEHPCSTPVFHEKIRLIQVALDENLARATRHEVSPSL